MSRYCPFNVVGAVVHVWGGNRLEKGGGGDGHAFSSTICLLAIDYRRSKVLHGLPRWNPWTLTKKWLKIHLSEKPAYLHCSWRRAEEGFFSSYVRYSTLLHLPPLRFHCVGGWWALGKNTAHSQWNLKHVYYCVEDLYGKVLSCYFRVQEQPNWQLWAEKAFLQRKHYLIEFRKVIFSIQKHLYSVHLSFRPDRGDKIAYCLGLSYGPNRLYGAQTKHIGMKPIATKPIDIKGVGYKTYRNYRYRYIKGTVSRDIWLLVFFMNQVPPSPGVYH